jgi:hypothetical protein
LKVNKQRPLLLAGWLLLDLADARVEWRSENQMNGEEGSLMVCECEWEKQGKIKEGYGRFWLLDSDYYAEARRPSSPTSLQSACCYCLGSSAFFLLSIPTPAGECGFSAPVPFAGCCSSVAQVGEWQRECLLINKLSIAHMISIRHWLLRKSAAVECR